MSSQNQAKQQPLYPKVLDSNPEIDSAFLSNPKSNSNSSPSSFYPSLEQPSPSISSDTKPSSLYPTVDMKDLANLFQDSDAAAPTLPPPVEETFLRIPGAILHLIDRNQSVEIASGEFAVVRLVQGESIVAVLARVGAGDDHDDSGVQWPLAQDEASVKLDDSHYFFSLHVPKTEITEDESEGVLNYGLTFASKGQEDLLMTLDGVLEAYSSFSVQKLPGKATSSVLDGSVAKEVTPAEAMADGPKRELMEKRSEIYWTTLAPNVEDYSGSVAKAIAKGSGQLIRGILWCGDVTVDRLKWGEEMMKRRTSPCSQPTEVSKDALKRMKRVKTVTKMSEKVVSGVLNGVVKVSGFVTGSIVNSKAGKKFFGLVPGEIALATLEGFGKVSDAVEVVGRNVLQTSSVVTTGVVSHRYGEQAADMTHEGLGAAGHALGTALAVFKIRKALNPKNSVKPKTLAKSFAKSAAAELKASKQVKK
ncbi:protein EARLY-RESPONSIVE TO DEHYDRATION 7, chloroplastic [Dendrobium catenatum]|uniref:Senescence domain-containing protein n=1 Tax=Dendrobium catenatum TaxID=906689 RepID=A0A2I0XB22_9ASPA|nr:protein EARLY-RESPONSIVE TO DEHYDRATION 7, chloroplastic [Dendrobium catenatum]PKU85101.1 hypothetical protein MA16_Dca018215 [Dendrobium catenatum]